MATATSASDWPQFLGPDRNGISPERGLLRAWPAEGPRVLWTRALGRGWGGAVVRDGQAYVLDRVEERQDVLRCLDLATGKELWNFAYDARKDLDYPGSRSLPSVDEQHVYILGPLGHLHCLDRATHQPVWQHQIATDFDDRVYPGLEHRVGPIVPKWGFTQHPLLYRDLVIVAAGTMSTGLVAYARGAGEVRWKSPGIGKFYFCHATPIIARLGGVDQIVAFGNVDLNKNPPAFLSGVDAATGERLWTVRTPKGLNLPIPSPVQTGDDRLFVTGGYRLGCFGVQVRREDSAWKAQVLFANQNCGPHMQTPVFYQGHIYAQSYDGYHNRVNHGLACLDPDGNLKWKTGPERHFDQGGMLIADGMIFVLDGRTGELTLAEASPEGFKELARARVLKADEHQAWAPLALADGKLLVRDLEEMKCLDVRGR